MGDLAELRSLSGAVALMEASRARCLTDLDGFLESSGSAGALAWAYDVTEEYGPKILFAYKHYAEGTSEERTFESLTGVPTLVARTLGARSDGEEPERRF